MVVLTRPLEVVRGLDLDCLDLPNPVNLLALLGAGVVLDFDRPLKDFGRDFI